MEKLGIIAELRENPTSFTPSQTRRGTPMRVKLQLVMCDDGHEATVTDIVTLKKNCHRLEPQVQRGPCCSGEDD
jgi:hypothetical protein